MVEKETKQMLQVICAACEAIEKVDGRPKDLNMSIKDLFKMETHRFFMYLSASDGVIASNERDYMNELFDAKLSTEDYEKLIKDTNTYSLGFEEDLPLSFKILALFEARDDEKTEDVRNTYPNLTTVVFDFYREAGIEFVSCDRDVDTKELDDLGMALAKKKYKLYEYVQGKKQEDY